MGDARRESYRQRFAGMSDAELINAFNGQVGNPGTGSAKMDFLVSLHDEFEFRDYDYSAIGDKSSLSFARKIGFEERVIFPLPDDPQIS